MVPTSILFFIFLIILDAIFRSIRDKNKIEKEKINRTRRPMERPEVKPLKEEKVSRERKRIKEEKTLPVESRKFSGIGFSEDNFLEDENTIEDEIAKGDLTRKRNPIKPSKENILKGIIYSEVLSKPKSLR